MSDLGEKYLILESNVTKLSFAVYPQDAYTKAEAKGKINVSIKGLEITPVKNQSSYYLFFGLPVGEYVIKVRSDCYFDKDSEPIKLEAQDQFHPQVPKVIKDPIAIPLMPRPCYPFPPGETLVRGILVDSNKNPIKNAMLKWGNGKIDSRTDDRAEFVIYFEGLTEEDLSSDKKFVKGDEDTVLNVKGENGKTIVSIKNVELGKTNSLKSLME